MYFLGSSVAALKQGGIFLKHSECVLNRWKSRFCQGFRDVFKPCLNCVFGKGNSLVYRIVCND